ncbi:MAG: hypothetical protein L3K24_16940 [Gammaproteobacteria bacterium]|nr:hypothetical protein [Gammaproteobacteria bacterium]
MLVLSGERYPGKVTGYKYKIGGVGTHPQKRGATYPVVEFIDHNKQKRTVSTVNMEFYFKDYNKNDLVYVYSDSETGKLIIDDVYSLWSQPLFLIIFGGGICYFGHHLKRK